jgi:hypothetical protein
MGAAGEDLLRQLGSQAESVGGIFAVHHHQVGPVGLLELWQKAEKGSSARLADDITDEQNCKFPHWTPLLVGVA